MTQSPSEKENELTSRIRSLEERVNLLEIVFEQELQSRRRSKLGKIFEIQLGRFHQYVPRPLRFPPTYATSPPKPAPKISIVTPSFGQRHLIEATIRSVLDQNYPNLAYHVQDGGSKDGTTEVLAEFNGRMTWQSAPDTGQTNAINRGFAKVDGDIMAYLNSDDLLAPGALAYVAHAFADPAIDVVYGHRICIDQSGREVGRWVLPRHDNEAVKWEDYIPQETMFWRRRVFEHLNGFDESFRFAMDWDFILRAQDAGFRFKRLPRFLGCFRVHGAQKTVALSDVGRDEAERLRTRTFGRLVDPKEIGRNMRLYLLQHAVLHRLYKNRLLTY